MPTEYTLSDLVKLAGVSPRTVRYYIAQGLLPAPSQQGPNSRYTEQHLDRLRLIRKLQNAHLPLAEIRKQLGTVPDDLLASLAEHVPDHAPSTDSALDYIESLLKPRRPAALALPAPSMQAPVEFARRAIEPDPAESTAEASPPPTPSAQPQTKPNSEPDRAQW